MEGINGQCPPVFGLLDSWKTRRSNRPICLFLSQPKLSDLLNQPLCLRDYRDRAYFLYPARLEKFCGYPNIEKLLEDNYIMRPNTRPEPLNLVWLSISIMARGTIFISGPYADILLNDYRQITAYCWYSTIILAFSQLEQHQEFDKMPCGIGNDIGILWICWWWYNMTVAAWRIDLGNRVTLYDDGIAD